MLGCKIAVQFSVVFLFGVVNLWNLVFVHESDEPELAAKVGCETRSTRDRKTNTEWLVVDFTA